MEIKPIETRYAGCRFRSRLEARWAVFFDHIGASWEYEPQGFIISGRPYLPDFLLTDCGAWVEVKGDGADLDVGLMEKAALHLPDRRPVPLSGPKLLILGPMPKPCVGGDWAWVGLSTEAVHDGAVFGGQFGFGSYGARLCPTSCTETSMADHYSCGSPAGEWLVPNVDVGSPGIPDAYVVARSARFEHGERP